MIDMEEKGIVKDYFTYLALEASNEEFTNEVKAIADQAGLILTRNIYVYPKTGKACYLQLLFWKKPGAAVLHPTVETENITIRDENNGYTEEYRNKTRNLYLAF